jgi:hypothetical protein
MFHQFPLSTYSINVHDGSIIDYESVMEEMEDLRKTDQASGDFKVIMEFDQMELWDANSNGILRLSDALNLILTMLGEL